MTPVAELSEAVDALLGEKVLSSSIRHGELTIEIDREHLHGCCVALRDGENTAFDQLIDVCGVDYLSYGSVEETASPEASEGPRFALVYHLLSVRRNHRLRVRAFLDDDMPSAETVTDIWACANWFEREAFDLFGIMFDGHPDLRRILTDYGFVGHPFRKDFPLSGYVEMRYDPQKQRVVYEPVTIEPRTLVPRTIREDSFGHRNP